MHPEVQRLVIISHVVHYCHDGVLYAYGPYTREIEVWADLFPELVIAAPCRVALPPADCLPIMRRNVAIARQRETGGPTLGAKLKQIASLPAHVWSLRRAARGADAIHVRCPGNLGLLGVLMAPLYSKRLVAKYAGQWNGYPGEPLSVRCQRALLRSRWWHGPVTVYGRWPDQPKHIVPFFTSVLSADQIARARMAARHRRAHSPLRILYVGRLSAAKNVDVLLQSIAGLPDLELECEIVGDGPERARLESMVEHLGLGTRVLFTGALRIDRVLDHYEVCDVLVLASETEGWPKAIAEAMAFGMVCIGSNRGLIPEILGNGRGLLVEPRSVQGVMDRIRQIAASPAGYASMSARAAEWSQQHSIEALGASLLALLDTWWKEERPERIVSSQLA